MLDLDGTLYASGRPIAGAVGAVAALRAAGIALRFATNTFATPPEGILRRLADYGFDLCPEELVTPRRSLEAFVRERPGLRMYSFLAPRIAESLPFLPPPEKERPEWILVGDADELWSYEAIDRLLGFLNGGAELLATSASRSFFAKDGREHLDTGSLVALLEAASRKRALVLGKPSAEFGRLIVQSARCSPARTLVVGDDPAVDMALAEALGAISVLVETGKGAAARRDVAPDAVIASIAELSALLGIGRRGDATDN